MPPASHTCLLVGDAATQEMRPVAATVSTRFPASRLRRVARLSDVRPYELPADLVVICQSWSDEYTVADVANLLSSAPLARLLCVYGRWCDSDGRTRSVWPLAVRVPVPDFERRIQREIDVLNTRAAPLPVTATRTEIFADRCRSAVDGRIVPAAPAASASQVT